MEKKKSMVALLGLILLLISSDVESGVDGQQSYSKFPHHRQKRFFWITNDGRIALPPGTIMTITPTLALPFVRYPPYGFLSNMTISLPFTIDFDKLGLTDNENPYGVLPSAFDGTARDQGSTTAEFIASFVKRGLSKREAIQDLPKNAFYGGERALLYSTAEDMLGNFGLNGRACLLRAICEVQGHPLNNFGLIGEMLKLFFTASKSPFAELLTDYVEAENRGKFHGECWPYFKDCPKSLFRSSENRYTKEAFHEATDTIETIELGRNKDQLYTKRMLHPSMYQEQPRAAKNYGFASNEKYNLKRESAKMNQANVEKLVSRLRYNVGSKPRRMRNPNGPEGRLEKIQKTLTALVKYERIELNYGRADETRGYAERLISEALRHGPEHKETMEMANFWVLEKQLVHKLFKVLVPRFQNCTTSYTKLHIAPTIYPGNPYKRAVLELRGNVYPSVEQYDPHQSMSLQNILLDAAKKEFQMEKYKEIAVNINM